MIKRFLMILLVLAACRPQEEDFNLRKSKIEIVEIESNLLNEERKIFISLPKNELSDKLGERSFPVIYVLDGEEMFDYVVSMVNFLSMSKGNDVLPKSIVVGIPNTNRSRDLTPNQVPGERTSGGGKRFASFIDKELMPYINQNYPTIDYKTVIGHSYGGLWTINALREMPEMFDNYIALDPSYQYLEKREVDYNDARYKGKQLFVGIANTVGGDTSHYQSNKNTKHFEELVRWTKKLEDSNYSEMRFWTRYYVNDDHASLCLEATYDALREMFSWYHLDILELRQDPARTKDIKKTIIDHYRVVSTWYNEKVLPDEEMVNRVAWFNLSADPEVTKELLKLNKLNYPNSFNARFALGNFFRMVGKTDSAKICFEAALKLKDDEKAKAFLNEMD